MTEEEELPEDMDYDPVIFQTSLAQNGQVTVKKPIRDRLSLGPGYIIFFQILKVITPEGETIYDVTSRSNDEEE